LSAIFAPLLNTARGQSGCPYLSGLILDILYLDSVL
jgi:hypothetical protein